MKMSELQTNEQTSYWHWVEATIPHGTVHNVSRCPCSWIGVGVLCPGLKKKLLFVNRFKNLKKKTDVSICSFNFIGYFYILYIYYIYILYIFIY